MLSKLMKLIILIICFAFFNSLAEVMVAASPAQQQERSTRASGQRRLPTVRSSISMPEQAVLIREVRYELVTLPFYDVFDWLEGEVRPDGTVVLRGQVVRPTTKADAEARVKDVKGVARIRNEIEVLPVSPNDDQSCVSRSTARSTASIRRSSATRHAQFRPSTSSSGTGM
jgi:hypothetical protein